MNNYQAGGSERLADPLRIAYFSPLPPERSGIADYSRELLPYLAQRMELVLYTADPQLVDEELQNQYVIHPIDQFPRERRGFDIPLYQMGNSEYHASIYPTLLKCPGLVVLHDYAIHNFIAHNTLEQGDFTGYAREMGYALGVPGVYLAYAIDLGQAPAALDLPLNDRLLDNSLGLIVHSNYVAGKIRKRGYDRPLSIIPALIEAYPGRTRRTPGTSRHRAQSPTGTRLATRLAPTTSRAPTWRSTTRSSGSCSAGRWRCSSSRRC